MSEPERPQQPPEPEPHEEDGAAAADAPESAPGVSAASPAEPTPAGPAEPPRAEEPATAEPPPPPPRTPQPAAPRRISFAEPPESVIDMPRSRLAAQSRRDFLLFAAGAIAAAAGAWWLLPDRAKGYLLPGPRERLDTLAARVGLTRERREQVLNRGLTFDDDVAEALYSKDRRVRTYARDQVTPLRNNYHGQTPGPGIVASWTLALSGLASGETVRLTLEELTRRFTLREQVTRLVCVEGWSAIAWWGGIRFSDLLAAFPPATGARWAALRSAVSLDDDGRVEPYYVSIDLGTARHPQTLLATQYDGKPLPLEHGAPLRLLAPMKLGLKNIKAVTDISYMANEPPDYWNERGYSRYDGL